MNPANPCCSGIHRRTFLADVGMGFTGLVLSALMARDGAAADRPHFTPKAKRVIWFFMIGGASQVETFDPKPALNQYAGKSIEETPYKNALNNPFVKDNLRVVVANDANGKMRQKLYPLQVGYRKRGQSGIEVSDWFPHLSGCIDDMAVVRSMWTTDNNHGAQLQFFTGRHSLEGPFPTVGSWVHYGLGALNEDLPQFVVLGTPLADCCGGANGHGSNYLGPEHAGVHLKVDPNNPLPFALPGADVSIEEQRAEFDLLGQLNQLTGIEYPEDRALRARIKSYELAFRMQRAVPDIMRLHTEPEATKRLYGLDQPETKPFGEMCLAARRLAERGVRFIQVFHGSNGGAGAWDAHGNLRQNHQTLCRQTDQPLAALLHDLKRTGMLEDTLVVWGTEFGRTPGAQGANGRDHHPYGFSVWLAGGGIKGGTVHGKTDELGFHAVEHRHYVTDLHTTVLNLLGLDSRRLVIPGRKRLEVDFGQPIKEIMA